MCPLVTQFYLVTHTLGEAAARGIDVPAQMVRRSDAAIHVVANWMPICSSGQICILKLSPNRSLFIRNARSRAHRSARRGFPKRMRHKIELRDQRHIGGPDRISSAFS